MGFFKNIFKRKPGGTVVGNLVRGVADNFSGGLYSSVYPKLSAPVSQPQPITLVKTAPVTVNKDGTTTTQPKNKNLFAWIIGGVALVGGLIALLFRKKGTKRKWRR